MGRESLVIEKLRGAAVIAPIGMLNFDNAFDLEEVLQELINGGERNLVIDMKDVTSVDSTVIGILFGCSGRLRGCSGDLRVCGLSRSVRATFEVLRLDELIPVFTDRTAALPPGALEGKPSPS